MRKTGLTAWFTHAAVRALFMVMQAFPIDWNLGTARLLARIWPRLTPRHRRRAVAHLEAALGQTLPRERIEQIADRSMESVAMFAVEVICLPRLINALTWPRYIRLINFHDALRLLVDGKGAILVTGHYGSFEIIGHLLAVLGFKVSAVMRPLDNAYLNRFLVSMRRRHGLTLLDKKGATANAQAILDNGELLAFIGDQDAGRKGLFVDFFGRPASTYKSVALLAIASRCPVVVGYARRQGGAARFEVGVQRIIYPSEWEHQDDPISWITQAYTAAIEAFVRHEPDQYLWIHRRWKSQPGKKRNGPRKTAATQCSVESGTGTGAPR
ncbi:MAG: lysophospholipid acyltransferase family protein [Phycisphaerae bacterium]